MVSPSKFHFSMHLTINNLRFSQMRGDLQERCRAMCIVENCFHYIFVNSVFTGNLVEMIFCPIEQGLYVRHRAYSERRQ